MQATDLQCQAEHAMSPSPLTPELLTLLSHVYPHDIGLLDMMNHANE